MIETEVNAELQARRELVSRVVSSDVICKSARLKELFLYLCHRVLDEGADHINELELGHRVFGRPQFYDTTADNTVRVHASTLRKRLAEYFQTQGRDEALTIEIPRGNYAPLFRARGVGTGAAEKDIDDDFVAPITVSVVPEPGRGLATRGEEGPEPPIGLPALPAPDGRLWTMGLLALCLALGCVYLLLRPAGGRPAGTHSKAMAPGTDVYSLWSQVFPPGGSGRVVMDDSSLDFYQQVTGRSVKLTDYFDRSYLAAVQERANATGFDPKLLHSILLRRQSNYADVNLAGRLMETATAGGSSATTVFARDLSFREMKADNMVLLGTAQSNPWIQLFEARLVFRWKLDPESGTYYPVDSTAEQGATGQIQPTTTSGEQREGYATLTLVPNLGTSGSVLIVSGTGGMAMAAAIDFLMDERSVHELRWRLPAAPGRGFPPFEALLRVDRGVSSPREVTLVKCRSPLEAAGNGTPASFPPRSAPRP